MRRWGPEWDLVNAWPRDYFYAKLLNFAELLRPAACFYSKSRAKGSFRHSFNVSNYYIMGNKRFNETTGARRRTRRSVNIWLLIGALVLIVLLFIWLTMADFLGDTDVAAFVPGAGL